MIRLVAALASNYSAAAIDGFLSIAAVPKRRRSIGVRNTNPANLIDKFLGRDLPAPLVLP
jgi:hypothetical protein